MGSELPASHGIEVIHMIRCYEVIELWYLAGEHSLFEVLIGCMDADRHVAHLKKYL